MTASSAPFAPALSILVCTYDRTDPLEDCLTRVRDQRALDGGPLNLPFEVIVVDNGPLGHSKAIVARVFAEPGGPGSARRFTTSPPNISIARNRCVAEALAPLVLFLDDDQTLAPDAIAQALAVLDETQADIVFGRIEAVDGAGAPVSNPMVDGVFSRRANLRRGAALSIHRPCRTPGFTPSTGVSLWRKSPWLDGAEPFDPAFGACGGEDLDLFMRAEASGARIHWAPDALAFEGVPADRMTERYLVTRAYSGAQVYTAAAVKNTPETPTLAWTLALKGMVQLAVWGSLALLLTLGPRGLRLKARVKAALALGKLFWRKRIPLYHLTFDGRSTS